MAIRAPFRFAPISRWVYFPDWAPLVSHDIPFKDGVSGEIGIEIEVVTPLLIGGARRKATEAEPGEVWPYKEPQGRYAIPGETLQGLIRSILSIATFGKLGPRIEKKRFGKAAHALSTHDMLRNSTPDHLAPDDPAVPPQEDLPDLIFGSVASATSGLKRRAAFDMAIAKTAEQEKRSLGPTILLAPKPSYYPIYVRQPQGAGGGPDGSKLPDRTPYATYTPPMDRSSDEHRMPELAGVKIWPALAPSQCHFPNLPPPPDRVGNKVKIYLNAVPAAIFATTLRVHNLRTVELGAVLWALTFGEAAALQGQPSLLRHRLGMGKPYGLGVVQIRITKARLTPNDPNLQELSQRDMATMVETFTSHMQRRCKSMNSTANWDKTAQVMALLKAADPQQNTDLKIGYMPLEPGSGTYKGERKESQFMPLYVPSVFEFARNARARPATPPAPAARRGQAGAAPNSLVPSCRVEDTDFQFGRGIVLAAPDRHGLVRVRFNHGEEMLHVSELRVLR